MIKSMPSKRHGERLRQAVAKQLQGCGRQTRRLRETTKTSEKARVAQWMSGRGVGSKRAVEAVLNRWKRAEDKVARGRPILADKR